MHILRLRSDWYICINLRVWHCHLVPISNVLCISIRNALNLDSAQILQHFTLDPTSMLIEFAIAISALLLTDVSGLDVVSVGSATASGRRAGQPGPAPPIWPDRFHASLIQVYPLALSCQSWLQQYINPYC